MGIHKKLRDFRKWSPKPLNPLPSKLKRYSAPIAVLLTATLILSVSFSYISSSYLSHPQVIQAPAPILNASSTIQMRTTWNIQTIDTTDTGSGELAIDSNNNPHIFYGYTVRTSDSEYFKGVYTIWNGSSWNSQNTPLEIKGAFNLALDSNNNPHLSYNRPSTTSIKNYLMYAYWTGLNWNIQTVTQERGGFRGFLALDSTGNPAIAYITDFGQRNHPDGTVGTWFVLKYASWNGSSWDTQTIDAEGNFGHFDSLYLALDKNNNPTIMYSTVTDYPLSPPSDGNATLYSVKFATWNGSAWNIQTAFNDLSSYGNMVLDSKGYPHFLYRQNYPITSSANSTLSYASWNGSVWNSLAVVSNASLAGYGAGFLALDSYDYPHIDYINDTSPYGDRPRLVYAGWTGSEWDFQIFGPNSLAIRAGPILMDSNGNAHILYTGDPDADGFQSFREKVYVMYATAPQPIYTPTPSPTQTSPTFFAPTLLLILTVVIIVTVVTAVYVWKRKLKKP